MTCNRGSLGSTSRIPPERGVMKYLFALICAVILAAGWGSVGAAADEDGAALLPALVALAAAGLYLQHRH